jgi:hypothetical protein
VDVDVGVAVTTTTAGVDVGVAVTTIGVEVGIGVLVAVCADAVPPRANSTTMANARGSIASRNARLADGKCGPLGSRSESTSVRISPPLLRMSVALVV